MALTKGERVDLMRLAVRWSGAVYTSVKTPSGDMITVRTKDLTQPPRVLSPAGEDEGRVA